MSHLNLIDINWLKGQYQGNLNELLEIYIRENDECMSKVNEALRKKNYNDLREVAHKMKGSSRIVGAFSIEDMADHIEKTIDPKELESRIGELQNTYSELRSEIYSILNKK